MDIIKDGKKIGEYRQNFVRFFALDEVIITGTSFTLESDGIGVIVKNDEISVSYPEESKENKEVPSAEPKGDDNEKNNEPEKQSEPEQPTEPTEPIVDVENATTEEPDGAGEQGDNGDSGQQGDGESKDASPEPENKRKFTEIK